MAGEGQLYTDEPYEVDVGPHGQGHGQTSSQLEMEKFVCFREQRGSALQASSEKSLAMTFHGIDESLTPQWTHTRRQVCVCVCVCVHGYISM